MPTAKKTAVKKSVKAPAKKAAAPKAKANVSVKAKVVAKPKVVAKSKPVVKPSAKLASHKPASKPTPHQAAPPKNESVFARLLREKAERHQAFLKQNEGQHHSHDQRMPQNHASYSKFAGPRRRAS